MKNHSNAYEVYPKADKIQLCHGKGVGKKDVDDCQNNGQKIGSFANDGQPKAFTPPMKGEAMDYVLILDDAAKHYPKPGGKLK